MRAYRPGQEHPALYGLSADVISDWCQVHVTTSRRWKRGEDPPYAALQWITVCNTGELGAIDLRWHGWHIKGGMLVSPDGRQSFSPGDVMAGPFWRQLAKSYQTAQRFEAQADWVDERWGEGADYRPDLPASG